jgi:predicted dehydrogenase
MHKITMLGAGLIGHFYTATLHGQRSKDRVHVICSKTREEAKNFAEQWGIPKHTTSLEEAINDPETDVVVIGLPNNLHKQATILAAEAGKAVLCTKPLARSGAEAKEMLQAVDKAGVFHGYLEDLVYTPKTLKAIQMVRDGAVGKVLWTRSRETHPGPHSDWFWNPDISGGGAIIDMGCHCIEVGRSYIGKEVKPLEVMCWAATQVHPIKAEDHGIGLIKYASGAIAQFETSWAFRGGMDLRDEVMGTEGTIWTNHFLRTGFEVFTSGGRGGYVAEKAETESGWIFPVGDEVVELGNRDMFTDMLDALDKGTAPRETYYDGYVVNCVMDAAYRSVQSKQWEPVLLEDWRGSEQIEVGVAEREYDDRYYLIKEEKMPDGRVKVILKDKRTGEITQKVQ